MKKKSSRALRSPGSRAGRSWPALRYGELLQDIKDRIQHSQTRAILVVNAELVRLYWDIGRLIDQRQRQEGWGAGVIPRLARDLHNELPEVKGFSERNINLMLSFYREYPDAAAIVQQPVARMARSSRVPQPAAPLTAHESLLWSIPWGHHALLIARVKDRSARLWYMQQTLANGWSRNLLAHAIDRREACDREVCNEETLRQLARVMRTSAR